MTTEEVEEFVVGNVPTDMPKQRESTMEDYWNTVSPFGIVMQRPDLAYSSETDFANTLDTSDETFKSVFDTADIGTQREMIKAVSVNHALKIAERRKIQKDSQLAIDQDGIAVTLWGITSIS
jgi:hypothetical protein